MTGEGTRQIKSEQVRTFTLERAQAGTYSASLSSELPVERWFGTEILSHEKSAVNLARCERGLVLLFNHDMNKPIGKVERVHIDGDKLRGNLVFGSRPEAVQIKRDVDEGMLGDISVRYSIDEYETKTDEHGHDTVTITRWTILEASIVTVPADHTVGIGRSRVTGSQPKEREMEGDGEEGDLPTGTQQGGRKATVADLKGRLSKAEERGARQAKKEMAERIEEIQAIFSLSNPLLRGESFDTLRDECIRDPDVTPARARELLMELIDTTLPKQLPTPSPELDTSNGRARARTVPSGQREPLIQAGQSDLQKTNIGIQRAIEFKAGMLSADERAKEAGQNEFMGYTLLEMGRAWAQRSNQRIAGLMPTQLAGLLLNDGRRAVVGLGTEDFTGILANVAYKALLKGWEESSSTWRLWCREGVLNDFKRTNRAGLSGVTLLEVVPENGEIPYGKFTDRTEYIQALTYAKLFKISRQALINDDLGAFTSMPRRLGAAADRTVNKAVYALLTAASGVGPTLNQDSVVLFHSSHNNYDATSGGITVDNLDAGRQKMRRQKDPNNSEPLNIVPKHLLVPTALETTANVLVASEYNPAGLSGATGGAVAPNPFRGKLNVISEPTLDDATNGSTAWYLLGDQNVYDTFEVAFVDGQNQPYIETQEAFNVDGTSMKIRLDFAVAALDFRAMYRKKGA